MKAIRRLCVAAALALLLASCSGSSGPVAEPVGSTTGRQASSTTTTGEPTTAGSPPSTTATTAGVPAASGLRTSDIAVGDERACSVADEGGVWCWSLDDYDPAAPWSTPRPIEGIPAMRSVRDGGNVFCGVGGDGSLWCWGSAWIDARSGPGAPRRFDVPGLVEDVSLGRGGGCVVLQDRSGWCWTTEAYTDGLTGRSELARVAPDAAGFAVGDFHSCVLLADTTVRCVGSNGVGQLGDGQGKTADDRSDAPVRVVGLSGVAAIRGGASYACALKEDGTVECWGAHPGIFDEVVSGPTTTESHYPCYSCENDPRKRRPMRIEGIDGATALSTGDRVACVVLRDATVACFGQATEGQLGTGAKPVHLNGMSAPVVIAGLTDVSKVDVGGVNVCAVLRTGRVACWGANGQAPQARSSTQPVPVLVPPA